MLCFPPLGSTSSSLPCCPLSPLEMERVSVAQKSPKKAKGKKKPIKVVYISNPMKVKVSASEFRALVQELTGQDSDIAENISKYHMIDESLVATEPSSEASYDLGPVRSNPSADRGAELYKSIASPFEMSDEAFNDRMLENFLGFKPLSEFR